MNNKAFIGMCECCNFFWIKCNSCNHKVVDLWIGKDGRIINAKMDNLIETKDNRDETNERLKDKEKLALINNKQDELMERLQLKLNKSREEIQSIIYEL